jgi:hypothetical protein
MIHLAYVALVLGLAAEHQGAPPAVGAGGRGQTEPDRDQAVPDGNRVGAMIAAA